MAGTSLNDIFILNAKFNNLKIISNINKIDFPTPTFEILNFEIDKKQPPDSMRLHQFTIVYQEIDGTIITKIIPEIYIMTEK